MAKSLRSKWKRKMRAEKRVRYEKKERQRLIQMLEDADTVKVHVPDHKSDAAQEKAPLAEPDQVMESNEEGGDREASKPAAPFSAKSLRNRHGTFPIWMAKRKVKRLSGQAKKHRKPKKKC